ncbi:KNOX2 protein [Raphanus sativus]|nr:KNOX2 protein [Raphanus sativus]
MEQATSDGELMNQVMGRSRWIAMEQETKSVKRYISKAFPTVQALTWEVDRLSHMAHYVLLLCSFKEQLQQHVRVHAMEAVMACWDIEQSLQSLTGVFPDVLGFGPWIPTESERSLMVRVRQELKHELEQGYKEKIVARHKRGDTGEEKS